MTNKETILIELLQDSLKGKIDPSINFNPKFLAEAILEKLNLNETFKERNLKNVNESIESFRKMIDDVDKDMDLELDKLDSSEKMLANFIRGQKTACEKLKESLTLL